MNKLLFGISLLGALALPSVVAPQVYAAPAPVGSMKTAVVTPFIAGLGDPRGLGFNDYKEGSLLVSDFAKGEVVDFDVDGKRRYTRANGLQEPTQLVSLPGGFFIAERKTGRVLEAQFGKLSRVGDSINNPVGVVLSGKTDSTPYVVSQSGKVSHLLPLDNGVQERALARI